MTAEHISNVMMQQVVVELLELAEKVSIMT